jgi:diguanylate cyclase (GGDEF)-like protein
MSAITEQFERLGRTGRMARVPKALQEAGLTSLLLELQEVLGDRHDALDSFVAGVSTALESIRASTIAMIQTNVDAAVKAERHARLAEDLDRQKRELVEHTTRLEQMFDTVRQEAAALAAANVDALFSVDELSESLIETREEAQRLKVERDQHRRRAEQLSEESKTITEANARAVEHMLAQAEEFDQVAEQARTLVALNSELEQKVSHDHLTGLYSRAVFDQRLEEAVVGHADPPSKPVSVLFIDVDHFKNYNDRNGHAAGDVALTRVATLIDAATREGDSVSRPVRTPARYGGEEFVVLLPGSNTPGALTVADRVRDAIAAYDFPHGRHQPGGRLTASIGVATLGFGESKGDFVERADLALYESKHAGRDRVTLAPPPKSEPRCV